jgi:hypothetical protein
VIAFLAGILVTVGAFVFVSILERVLGWPQGHLLRRFERRVDRLRRRALRQIGVPSPDGRDEETAARND